MSSASQVEDCLRERVELETRITGLLQRFLPEEILPLMIVLEEAGAR